MRGAIVFFSNLALGLGLLGFVLWQYGDPALQLLSSNPSPTLLLVFAALVGLTIACLSWRWAYLLAGLGQTLALTKLILYRSGAHTLAVLIPSGKVGGDPLRAWLTIRARVPAGPAIASVVVDRTQEAGSTAPFSLIFAAILLQAEIPHIERALFTVIVGTLGLAGGIVFAMRRLRRGAGLVSSLARATRIDRLSFVTIPLETIEASETAIFELAEQLPRMLVAFGIGLIANILVVIEFALLLSAFDLPSDTTAIAAALFATGAAHLLPVPAGIGVLEGAQMWLFGVLGYPEGVGLAVGLAVRLRELLWMLPGLIYLLGRAFMNRTSGPTAKSPV